ncbi:hypothetical protein DB31_2587 [Hyalangium minutum]|uniref:Uncharacterized protein n=1 Tax=Hyalangium minutum TaxID=394096 RepID=A0A085W706_9BACT|nr:hypothetical protein DB31_2587 [Hyalangium minutum]
MQQPSLRHGACRTPGSFQSGHPPLRAPRGARPRREVSSGRASGGVTAAQASEAQPPQEQGKNQSGWPP